MGPDLKFTRGATAAEAAPDGSTREAACEWQRQRPKVHGGFFGAEKR
jgi:hypothetical protein